MRKNSISPLDPTTNSSPEGIADTAHFVARRHKDAFKVVVPNLDTQPRS